MGKKRQKKVVKNSWSKTAAEISSGVAERIKTSLQEELERISDPDLVLDEFIGDWTDESVDARLESLDAAFARRGIGKALVTRIVFEMFYRLVALHRVQGHLEVDIKPEEARAWIECQAADDLSRLAAGESWMEMVSMSYKVDLRGPDHDDPDEITFFGPARGADGKAKRWGHVVFTIPTDTGT